MENVTVMAVTAAEHAAPAHEPRWPVGAASLIGWLYPATTARRTAHASLLSVWFVHLTAAVLTVTAILLLITWSEVGGALDLGAFIVELNNGFRKIGEWLRPYPVEYFFTIAGFGLMIEAAFPAVALLVMPWGARDEPLRKSYKNALRQTWLRTTHIIPAVVVVGTWAVLRKRLYDEWYAANPSWLRPSRPWYVQYGEPLIVLAGVVMAGWLLWALLRAVGARRDVPPIARPPMCEVCGYNLTTIPMESRCPECGETVIASLGPDARSGTAWQQRHEIGRWVASWRCGVAVLRRPRQFGRQLPLADPGTEHRSFFALHLPVILCIGALAIIVGVTVSGGARILKEQLMMAFIVAAAFGGACVMGAVCFTNLVVAVIGTVESLRHRRNLLPGAMQAACYLAGYLVLWALFGALMAMVAFLLAEAGCFHALEELTGVDRGVLWTLTWILPNVACCVEYFGIVSRATSTTTHANR